jgi:hypothetical protein
MIEDHSLLSPTETSKNVWGHWGGMSESGAFLLLNPKYFRLQIDI